MRTLVIALFTMLSVSTMAHQKDKVVLASDSTSGNEFTMNFLVGFNAATKVDEGASFNTFRSFDIALHLISWEHAFDKDRHNIFNAAVGLQWQHYGVKDKCMYDVVNTQDDIQPVPFPAGVDKKRASINIFGFTGTIRYEYNFNEDWAIGFGPVVILNTYMTLSQHYRNGDYDFDITRRHVKPRLFTYGAMVNAKISGFPLYVKYMPCDVLKDGSTKFQSLSFGLFF